MTGPLIVAAAQFPKFDTMRGLAPNPAVNTDARWRGFACAAVAGYLGRFASLSRKSSEVISP